MARGRAYDNWDLHKEEGGALQLEEDARDTLVLEQRPRDPNKWRVTHEDGGSILLDGQNGVLLAEAQPGADVVVTSSA